MYCATPNAPARLIDVTSKLLSCQIRLAKNGIGRSLARATDTTALHMPLRDSVRGAPMRTSTRWSCGVSKASASSESWPSVLTIRSITEAGSGVTGWLTE